MAIDMDQSEGQGKGQEQDPFDASLDLLRRLDPKNVSQNLNALCKLAPALAEELLSATDQPLGVRECRQTKRKYLTCDFNRDGDSYRSPWSGQYEPAVEDAPLPSADLRKLEVLANDSFDIYRDLYYEGGVSSVYLWDSEEGFAGVVLLKKGNDSGGWDAVHVFEVDTAPNRRMATYRLTSTVMLALESRTPALGRLGLTGSLTRQTERELAVDEPAAHVANIGATVEDVESKLRHALNEVYFGKTRDIVGDLRSVASLADVAASRSREAEVARGMA